MSISIDQRGASCCNRTAALMSRRVSEPPPPISRKTWVESCGRLGNMQNFDIVEKRRRAGARRALRLDSGWGLWRIEHSADIGIVHLLGVSLGSVPSPSPIDRPSSHQHRASSIIFFRSSSSSLFFACRLARGGGVHSTLTGRGLSPPKYRGGFEEQHEAGCSCTKRSAEDKMGPLEDREGDSVFERPALPRKTGKIATSGLR